MTDKPVMVPYDEFSYFHENASEWGLPYDGPPVVARRSVSLPDGHHLSALVWGTEPPELVLLHGGAQNAHTWDTVAMALGRPLVAIDLPGHGHSDAPAGGSYELSNVADEVAAAIEQLAPDAAAVIGMSMGGLTSIALADRHPELVRRLILVDVTPGVTPAKSQAISNFVNGPESFPDLDAILARTIEHNPGRSESSLRRGILHNAEQQPDGSWKWRYARHRDQRVRHEGDHSRLWDALERVSVPVMLVRGMRAQSVVDDADESEVLRRQPGAVVAHVDAGHSVQGDAPLELARLITEFVK